LIKPAGNFTSVLCRWATIQSRCKRRNGGSNTRWSEFGLPDSFLEKLIRAISGKYSAVCLFQFHPLSSIEIPLDGIDRVVDHVSAVTLIVGRLLLGVGMACNLMGPLKLITTWFSPLHFATLFAILVSVGTAGNIAAEGYRTGSSCTCRRTSLPATSAPGSRTIRRTRPEATRRP
jgi:hypothetical protein